MIRNQVPVLGRKGFGPPRGSGGRTVYGPLSSSTAYVSFSSSLRIRESLPSEGYGTCGMIRNAPNPRQRSQTRGQRSLTPAHHDHSSRLRVMFKRHGYRSRQGATISKISSLFYSLDPSRYNEVAPKTEFWIVYALAEHLTTVDELVEEVSLVLWNVHPSYASVARFLKEFRDAPHRSEQARSFVDGLCSHILRWFAGASAGGLTVDSGGSFRSWGVAMSDGECYIRAASCVGHLIEWGLLRHELVRQHLAKPLTAHHYGDNQDDQRSVRAMAIYQLFVVARSSLLQGLLDPEDVKACFEALNTKITLKGVVGPDAAELSVWYFTYLSARIKACLLIYSQETP